MSEHPLAVLDRIRRSSGAPAPGERCELCSTEVSEGHSHVVDLDNRGLLCACRPCALLFTSDGAAGGRFRTVGDRYLRLVDFALAPGRWDALQIPVTMAFFFRNSRTGDITGFYPSPAGATECLLPLDAWEDIERDHPLVASLEPDVEAVLLRVDPVECFIVPIDACYELVGHLRRLWRGFDGGSEAHEQVRLFFLRVGARAHG
ncbi:MAG: DUF5947 family protein [Acidimicrobiales bacterium]